MFKSNGDIYQKGKDVFVERFKAQLKKNRNWDVDVVWEESTDKHTEKDEVSFAVRFYVACTLTLPNDVIEDFAMDDGGVEKTWCQAVLDKKERELVKKIQQTNQ